MLKDKKVVILLFDSFGIGQAPDAADFGDEGADTLGHIVDYFTNNGMSISLPNLSKKGLKKAAEYNRCKEFSQDIAQSEQVENAKYGYCAEVSKGKDTPSGHWELAGVPVMFDWYYFTKKQHQSCFDKEFIDKWVERAGITEGFIDAGHASGTEVLKEHGCESCVTKKPIIYTSADSVFQVAAHEDYYGLDKLLKICLVAREVLDEMGMKVGRVIARPFIGESADEYVRTGNRRDFSILPPAPTLLDKLVKAGGEVVSIGKIADIYANQGITKKVKATGLEELFDKTIDEYTLAKQNTLVFTNFVDLDSSFGHRRDPKGYGKALEYLDSRIPDLDAKLDDNTIVVLAADHGCDSTAPGSDHTRECVPFLLWGRNIKPEFIGARDTFADIGQTIADFMGIESLEYGKSIFGASHDN
ncbi:phosphopentomutase [Francisella tularensis subsp. holarctica FSC022]|uniref:phosphopentomutase n=1 Tax=Francisella tularensis TaxID=263 RepID=UPI00015D7A6D|nr:phosphopentomutase [Francisella tularensis]ALK94259.1 phosphopentomutase [Francisella tularensis]EDO66889.1 phosphopentomutase [Francisella tularensis subsp. holarctica FSC022]KIP31618.1 phosphopentomutase [Francisella tularensis subsp. holarctica]MCC9172319.1 phosphopentomutase [Francisella tularensis]OCQ67440.1 phosphopentomutase [Francisella tularensis]